MCGIAGCIGEDRGRIEHMVRALAHRGPDGEGIFVGHGVSLGHARLAILDPRPEGNQPMWSEDGAVAVVYNGEIFNYRELREKEGFICKTGTDTEVLIKLYERYGIGCVRYLRGMFAFGLYDVRRRRLHLVRDAAGIKPLFYTESAGGVAFASEMRALLAGLPQRPALNFHALSLYLRLQYVPGPATLCEGVRSVEPGAILTWHDGVMMREQFDPIAPRVLDFPTRARFAEEFPAVMDDAVREHLVSDRPVGMYLSGGMDSSIVLHHMARHASGPVRTFTVRFDATAKEGAARFNVDADLAALTAKRYGTEHTEILLTAQDYRDHYAATARALDQPNADSVSVAQFMLSRVAKPSVDVVLCGAGGDELFGGYPRYRIARILQMLRAVPSAARAAAGAFLGYPADVLRLHPGPVLAERLLARPVDECAALIRGAWFRPEAVPELFASRFHGLGRLDPVLQMEEFDRHLWLVDESLRLMDATTMAHGVEGRIPFLDPRVIVAAHAVPTSWHVTPRRTKALLKDVYRSVLPAHLYTLKKASFYPPLAKWLRREAAPLAEAMLEHPRIRELFDAERLRTLFDDHCTQRRYGLHPLSSLIQLAFWFDEVYDAAR